MEEKVLENNTQNILDKYKTNIVSWYDFKYNSSILLIGNIDKIIIKFFCDKFEKVFMIKDKKMGARSTGKNNFKLINENDLNKENIKFNYILFMNYFNNSTDDEIVCYINDISNFISDDGKILTIFQNKMGAREIAKKSFEGFSRNRLQNIFQEINLKYDKFYYILPNENYTNIIFSDEYLPDENDMRRNLDFFEQASNIGTIENTILIKSLSDYKKDFKILANSFFVEISKKEIKNEIKAVFYSNIRNEKYQIRTKILDKIAVKENVYESGIAHIDTIKKNVDILKKCNINTLDSHDGNKIISKLAVDCETLESQFLKLYKDNDAKYKNIIDKFKNDILLKLEVIDKKDNIFEKLNIDISDEILDKLTFIKHGLWDLTLQNTFLVDDELYVYDQEWYEENIPLEFILYRSFLHGLEPLSWNEKDELCKELEIFEYKGIFYELEEKLQNGITNDDALELYKNSLRYEDEIKFEKEMLLKEIDFQNDMITSEKLGKNSLQSSYDIVSAQRDNLEKELILKNNQINELQVMIRNSKALKYTRSAKDLVKKVIRFCKKTVEFICKKTFIKNIQEKFKEVNIKKNTMTFEIKVDSVFEDNMKLYNQKENTYQDVLSLPKLDKKIGIHLHLYYEDLAGEFYEYLNNMPYQFDLYISIRQGVSPKKIEIIFKSLTNLKYLEVKVSENCGRDFGPMYVLFAKKLRDYDYIMHIHSKKSLRSGQEQTDWRRYLLDNLLGSSELIKKEFYLMEKLNCGLVYPDTHSSLSICSHTWLAEKELAKKIMKEIGIEFTDEFLEFSAGSMFWAKSDALRQLLDLNLTWEDFGKDKHQVEGTLEYVFERIPGTVVKYNNYNIAIYNTTKKMFLLNKGNKSAEKYFEFNCETFMNNISKSAIATFDVFETLVTTELYDNNDIFLLVDKEIKTKNIKIDDYIDIRKKAELRMLEKNNDTKTYTIHEIYDEMSNMVNLSKEKILEIKNVEIEVIEKLCIPRKDTLKIYEETINMGKKIILVSDTYLTKDIVEKIVNKCGYHNYDDIWVSSEMKIRKDDETMWQYFLSKYGKEITIHFGDDEQNDIHFLANRGRQSMYLMRGSRLLELSNYYLPNKKLNLSESVLLGLIYNKSFFNSPFSLYDNENQALVKTPYDFGYGIIGPVIFKFILDTIKSLKNETLIFISDKYNYMQKIYNQIKKKMENAENLKEYSILISEKLFIFEETKNIEELFKLFNRPFKGSLREIIYYKIGYVCQNFGDPYIELPRDMDLVKNAIMSNYDAIVQQFEYEKKNYLKYIESLNLTIKKENAYLITFKQNDMIKNKLSKLTGKNIVEKPISLPNNLAEKLTISYESFKYIDEFLRPHYKFQSVNTVNCLDAIYNGVMEFIDDFTSIYGNNLSEVEFSDNILEENFKAFMNEIEKINGEFKEFLD